MTVIQVSQLRKQYRDHVAVHDVSFNVERGEIFGMVGPNGAGKTTTVECVTGLRTPDAGQITVLGLDPQRDRSELRQRVGVQLQSSALPDKLKVWEALDLYASFYRRPAPWPALLDQLGLVDKRNATFDKLSGGQKQRLSIALALVGQPEVAVLDELTTGLDPQARREVWRLLQQIRASGVTILLVTHYMEEVERLCDRVAVIDAGRVVALDTPAGLVARARRQQHLRFRPSAAFDPARLADLPEVTHVVQAGDQIVVTGNGNLLHAVSAALLQAQVTPDNLRVEQPTLEDAFLSLTGHALDA
jgi:ABC-2 type transport system ATP-binding protein